MNHFLVETSYKFFFCRTYFVHFRFPESVDYWRRSRDVSDKLYKVKQHRPRPSTTTPKPASTDQRNHLFFPTNKHFYPEIRKCPEQKRACGVKPETKLLCLTNRMVRLEYML